MTKPETVGRTLRNYLNLYWLRPATALWRTSDALAVEELGVRFTAPLMDLACGDGLNSYVLLGKGDPPLSVDAYLDIDQGLSRNDFISGRVDMYDHASGTSFALPAPPAPVDVGLDLKQGLLAKASRLNLYRQLIQHDANTPFPVAADSFATIFSNALYSIPDLKVVLSEIHRVLRPGGRLVALLTSENFRKYAIHRLYEEHGWEWCKVLDRGRHKEVVHCYAEQVWREHLQAAGLKVLHMKPYLSSRLYSISEVDLRLLSPVLIRMANTLNSADRSSAKKDWIEYCMELAYPMFTSGWLTDLSVPQIYFLAVAEKDGR